MGKVDITGISQSTGKVLTAVGLIVQAVDGIPADLRKTLAIIGAVHPGIRPFFHGCRCGDNLKNTARRKGAGQGIVQIRALIGIVGFDILRHVGGIERGGAYLAQDIPRFVVVDNHRAVVSVQSVVGRHAGILVHS